MTVFVIKMAIIAFIISMFVAFIIDMLYKVLTSSTVSKYYNQKIKNEYQRAKRIKKIRIKRIYSDIKALELMESNEIIDYYYGKRNIKDEEDLLTKWNKNDI